MNIMQKNNREFVSLSTIAYRSGTEGPAHDLYAYEEWTLSRGADVWKIHDGLGRWLEFNGNVTPVPAWDAGDSEFDELLRAAGCPMTFLEISKCHRRLRARPVQLHKAHGTPHWADGFPGETLLICPCGSVLDSEFDLSSII